MGMRARRNPVRAVVAALRAKGTPQHKADTLVASTLNSGGLPL